MEATAPLARLEYDKALRILTTHGYKVTGPRREILGRVLEQERPFTAEQIVDLVPNIGRATVYRTLEILASVDLVARLIRPGGHPSYIVTVPGHLHHIVCSECGRSVAFTECPIDELVADLAQDTGYVIRSHHLEIEGLCPGCAAPATASTT